MYNIKPLGYNKETDLFRAEVCGGIGEYTSEALADMVRENIITVIDKSLDGTDGLYNYCFINELLTAVIGHYMVKEYGGDEDDT